MAYYGAPGYGAQPAYGAPGAPPGYGAPAAPVYGAPAYGAPAYAPAAPAAWSPYTSPGFQPQNPTAWALFQAVDRDRSGQVSKDELHLALSNGGWTSFSKRTTRLLIKMFDNDGSAAGGHTAGQLSYPEFEKLLAQLQSWRAWFESADRDRSGKLNVQEVSGSVRQFGFNLPDHLLTAVFRAYDEDNSGALGFDEYIQLLAELNALTALFRRHDPAGTGHATLDYSTFLGIVFATRS